MAGHLNRDRIREFLMKNGPVEDAAGQATAILRAAITYGGSDVGFSQLLSAMEERGEITRDVRGKRTYRISAARSVAAADAAAEVRGRRAAAGHTSLSSHDARQAPAASPTASAPSGTDYDALAAALLDRVVGVLAARQPADQVVNALREDLRLVTAERDQLRTRIEECEERLARADRNTAILLQMMNPPARESADTRTSVAGRDLIDALLSSLGAGNSAEAS